MLTMVCPHTSVKGGFNISSGSDAESGETKTIHIRGIPYDLYWALVKIKAELKIEKWLEFFQYLVDADIDIRGVYISADIDAPLERIYISNVPKDLYWAISEFKTKLRASNWIDLLSIIANARITSRTPPDTPASQPSGRDEP